MVVDVYGETVNFVISDNMPIGAKEHVVANADDTFTVLLNGKYDQETLKEAAEHALEHIRNKDFEKAETQKIEAEAHGIADHDRKSDDLPDWAVDMIRDLIFRSLAAEAVAEYYRQVSLDRMNDMEFRLQEDKWLYDV